jgi:hypothetical protein
MKQCVGEFECQAQRQHLDTAPRDNPRGGILHGYQQTSDLEIINEDESGFLSDRMQEVTYPALNQSINQSPNQSINLKIVLNMKIWSELSQKGPKRF